RRNYHHQRRRFHHNRLSLSRKKPSDHYQCSVILETQPDQVETRLPVGVTVTIVLLHQLSYSDGNLKKEKGRNRALSSLTLQPPYHNHITTTSMTKHCRSPAALSSYVSLITVSPRFSHMQWSKRLTKAGRSMTTEAHHHHTMDHLRPPNSTNHYVGIWYKKISTGTVVWVANRNSPLTDTYGELTLTLQGVLILRDATKGNVVWSSANSSKTLMRNPIGHLLDTGNFIIYEEGGDHNQENPIWQSFDFVTDTLLPGMKYGRDFVTGIERHYTSWRSKEDPASGEFALSIDIRGYPQSILTQGQQITYRVGPWNGVRGKFTTNTIVSRQEWNLYLTPEIDQCDRYAICGPYASCNIEKSPVCECLKGFTPTSPDQWRVADWSQGCRHTVPLDCDPEEGFNKYSNMKLPNTQGSWYNLTMTLVECEQMCKTNCSCTAYANSNISGNGCLLWFGGLIDIRTVAEDGDTIYIRLSASELGTLKQLSQQKTVKVQVQGDDQYEKKQHQQDGSGDEDLELPLFGLSTVLKATNNFSMDNKLGEGGFGPVYKLISYINLILHSGYMAPEYAGGGIFSIKSDVYSFGVLVLEIVCGEKNKGFVHKEHCNNLIGHAWVLYNENRSLELVAKCLGESINVSQVLRSIHVALLCVQRHPEDRPTMTSVIVMLASQGPLPSPKEPGFCVGKTTQDNTQSSSSREISSTMN
ncbi:hypothetical protein M8C21_011968, partial [Ambrosia artemisiifolia]